MRRERGRTKSISFDYQNRLTELRAAGKSDSLFPAATNDVREDIKCTERVSRKLDRNEPYVYIYILSILRKNCGLFFNTSTKVANY